MASIQEIFLDRLEYFLDFLDGERPGVTSQYTQILTLKYQSLINNNFSRNSPDDPRQVFSEFKNLTQHSELLTASLNYYLELLQVQDDSPWKDSEFEISMKALIQAWTYPSYYLLEALTETIDKDAAYKLYKRYITQFYLDHPSVDRDENFSLDEMLEKRLSGDTESSEWVIVHTMLEDGKYAFKNKNCPTCVDAMVDLPDIEIKYLVCCYGDYEKFRSTYSEHLILTMEHTIMEGAPYCSRVLHDTRVDYDLHHPPEAFWDNFEPGKERDAEKYYKKMKQGLDQPGS